MVIGLGLVLDSDGVERTGAVTLFGPFELEVRDPGIALVNFDRPPVNAFSLDVYESLGELTAVVAATGDIRVLVLAAPPEARAWCGGADVRDFQGMDAGRRKERYSYINAVLPRFANLDRPTIAAISAHAVGVGVILAGMCDLRVAADSATFACPEINYGLVGGGAGLFSYLNMPEAIIREMLFTGRRFTAGEMHRAGYLNDVVPREQVLDRALELACTIAGKSLPALKARKSVLTGTEGMSWQESYQVAQTASAQLVGGEDAEEGVSAFLEHRTPRVVDE